MLAGISLRYYLTPPPQTRVVEEGKRQFVSQTLSKRVVSNTAYDDQGKFPCDEDTRIDILADIRNWVHDISGSGQRFLWLTGDPGSGKSAITASIARESKDENILWAQFFINRSLGNTTNPASYFPSIAHQLADRSPEVALAMHDALKEKPSLVDDISQLQAGKLFVDSLKTASLTDCSKPVVVIIDALDETDTTRLRTTAEIFSQALTHLPCNVKVFISSRAEDDIRKPFSHVFHVDRVKHIHLDTSAESSIQDVSTYLERNVGKIVKRNELSVVEWPGKERMRRLCDRASGLFIWAVTVVKFIQDHVEEYGKECLEDILNELGEKGMEDINVLYGTILQLTHKNQKDPWAFRRLVGCIIVLQQPLCLKDIITLLDLRKNTSHQAVHIEHRVRRLRTVLVAGVDEINGETVPRLHRSFFEYVISKRADTRFRVDEARSHAEIALQCLRLLVSLAKKPGGTEANGRFPPLLRYACQFWTAHLPPATPAGVALTGKLKLIELQELLQYPSNDRFQLVSNHVAIPTDGKKVMSSLNNFVYLHDVKNDVSINFCICHTEGVHTVAFSPDGKKFVSGSEDHTLRLWDASTSQTIGSPFVGHSAMVASVAFSPDGGEIVSGSLDDTLRLWDVSTGRTIGSPFVGHSDWVISVAFSPDGQKILSGSEDCTLRLWSASTGQTIGSPFRGHSHYVTSVAFSPDGEKIVSGSEDHTLRIWDASTGQTIGTPFKGHSHYVRSVAFSPDGEKIVSGSEDHTLRLWDASTGQTIGSPFVGHSTRVISVAFSPDGKKIVSGSGDHTLRLWDASTGLTIGSPFKGHSQYVASVTFSPDGKKVLSGSGDRACCLWDVESGQPIPIKGHHGAICISPRNQIVSAFVDSTIHVCYAHAGQSIRSLLKSTTAETISLTSSPNGRQFAAASLDGSVHLWDADSHKLIASYGMDCINEMSSIIFSSDGKQLMTFSIDGTAHIWDATSGRLLESSQPLKKPSSIVLHSEGDKPHLRWFPVDNPDFGHWAYIDSTLIRRDRDGLLTIMDMSDIEREWNPSPNVGDPALPEHPDVDESKNIPVSSNTTNIHGDQYNVYNYVRGEQHNIYN
ncbi:hypothetical protein PILCRDRAFT_309458 [Piloderma croceum F 1598]|uniref:Nephrocystin 3-like N-terminal domain-containing protein n=1 Tax=Piloderma croceum (strain F 1598) TaxID=765440 RepID=A0A0C3BJT7_PILCF|nr:hypothetical protein PILCRDRAFT_309458 [Piloderma croceum F 1598]